MVKDIVLIILMITTDGDLLDLRNVWTVHWTFEICMPHVTYRFAHDINNGMSLTWHCAWSMYVSLVRRIWPLGRLVFLAMSPAMENVIKVSIYVSIWFKLAPYPKQHRGHLISRSAHQGFVAFSSHSSAGTPPASQTSRWFGPERKFCNYLWNLWIRLTWAQMEGIG